MNKKEIFGLFSIMTLLFIGAFVGFDGTSVFAAEVETLINFNEYVHDGNTYRVYTYVVTDDLTPTSTPISSTSTPVPTPTISPTNTPTATPSTTTCNYTVEAMGDTYVRSGSNASTNYGNNSVIEVKTHSFSNEGNYLRQGLIQFDLSAYQNVSGGILTFSISDIQDVGANLGVYSAVGTWSENSVNWNNKPSIGVFLDSATIDSVGSYQFDVGTESSFVLWDTNQANELLDVDSRESAIPPTLTFEADCILVTPTPTSAPDPNASVLVAFWADHNKDSNVTSSELAADYTETWLHDALRTTKLVAFEGADIAIVLGDLAYDESDSNSDEEWNDMITAVLGADYPLFAVQGNHDHAQWNGYQTLLTNRLNAINDSDLSCSVSEIGLKMTCSYRHVSFVLSAVGEGHESPTESWQTDNSYEAYIKDSLAAMPADSWQICGWHRNMRLMQTGGKSDATGWKPYEYCRQEGALIVTGHEHSYSRSHLIGQFHDDLGSSDVIDDTSPYNLSNGFAIGVVNGMGGTSVRSPQSGRASNPWWGGILNGDTPNHPNAAVLFCEFGLNTANCYLKGIDGNIYDTFTLIRS